MDEYKWIWMPQKDITVWELAMALNVLGPVWSKVATSEYVDTLIAKFPPAVARHFEKQPV